MSLQECLASRKDCSGKGRPLLLPKILDICNSTLEATPSKSLFIVLPDGTDYPGGIYKYNKEEFVVISDSGKTSNTMELYPEILHKEPLDIKKLIDLGLNWQYLSLKVGSFGLGVSQRARVPKKIQKLVNSSTDQKYTFLYTVAVRERDRDIVVKDVAEPLQIKPDEGVVILDTPTCYQNRVMYEKQYRGIPLDSAIFNKIEEKPFNFSSLHQISQLLWACQGEADHSTHGNRDPLEKNGYGRIHASGCAGYSVYPMVYIDDLANLEKGFYWYNPMGFSALNRWIYVRDQVQYDHTLHKYSSLNSRSEIEEEFGITCQHSFILLCIDRKKPCSGFMHSKVGKIIMDTKYWAEVEAGMALAGLQLQANAFGLKWQKVIISNPDDTKYRSLFNLSSAEDSINEMALKLVNLPKNEKLSLKGQLMPIVLFSLR
ncbi:MAG: hypothetical protein ACXADU_02370 [Promethearchaeota archaeon]|jgi:hypothetical protein